MRNLLLSTLIGTLLFSFACTGAKSTSSNSGKYQDPTKALVYEDSERLSPVLEKAQQKNKAVFVVFSADWCVPCRVMKEEVFSNKQAFYFLNKNFLNHYVDVDSDSGELLAGIYEVSALPTVLFLDPQGVVIEKYVGMAQVSDIQRMGNIAIRKVQK